VPSNSQSLELLYLLLVLIGLLSTLLDEFVLSSLHISTWVTRETPSHHVSHLSMLNLLLLILLLLRYLVLSASLLTLKVGGSPSLVIIILVSMLNGLVKYDKLLLIPSEMMQTRAGVSCTRKDLWTTIRSTWLASLLVVPRIY
jgi:hypothetical protein